MAKKVLMLSHGVTGVTGFANQLWLQATALKEAGYEVLIAHRDYRGEPFKVPIGSGITLQSGKSIEGMHMLPLGNAQWGDDIMPYYIQHYKPDYVHTLGDIWCYQYLRGVPKKHPWKWLGHYVFDTENMVGFWNESIAASDISVVPSKNSFELCKSKGHKNIKYVPHGINTKTFVPCTHEEKLQYRKEMGIPEDAFVVGMVAHNQYRKMVNRLVDSFEMFVKNNPRSILLMHCVPRDSTGWDLPVILKDKNLLSNVMFTDKSSKGFGDIHVPESAMRKLYCTMDVHALSTGGEGFGIPLIESLACGIPTVAPAYTTPKEFFCDEVEVDGKKLLKNVRGFAVPYTEYETHHTGGTWCKVDRIELAKTLQYVKDNSGEAKSMAMKGMKFVQENYDNEVVKKQWVDLYNNFDEFVAGLEAESQVAGLRALRINPNG